MPDARKSMIGLVLGAGAIVPALGTSCNACGSSATYSETISTSDGYQKRRVQASGCPNHYSFCTGKGDDGVPNCGELGKEGSGSEATEQDHSYDIPASPVLATSTTDKECDSGAIAIALNGVSIYSGWVATGCELLDVTDSSAEWTSFDFCSGHSAGGPGGGDYHYHFPPSCLLDQATSQDAPSGGAAGHSPQIGWSFDGFPIYGPLGVGGNSMNPQSSCTGDYCLDECSGQEKEIPDLDGFKYRYYITGATSDLHSLPGDPKPAAADYPFTLNCYKGCTWSELSADNAKCTGGASGVTSNYTAAALDGYASMYVSSAPEAATMRCGVNGSDDDSSMAFAPSSLACAILAMGAMFIT